MQPRALHIVTTGRQELEQVIPLLERCRSEWIDVLHIREKARTAREHVRWYTELSRILPHTRVYINDRLDAAAAVEAPGVQLAYHSLPLALARKILPPATRIGCSVHSAAEAQEACRAGADYVLFGHVYDTASKSGLPGRGTGLLAEVVGAATVPVIAIGGITPDNVPAVLAAGCAGIAVMSSVMLHPQPDEQIRLYRKALDCCKTI